MPLAFVIILAPVAVLAMGALLCLILGLFYVLYLQPFIDWLTRKSGGFLGRLIKWTTSPVTNFVKGFVNRHIALLMRSFVTGIAPMVIMLNQLAVVVQRTYGTLGDMSAQILEALRVLRHVTLPNEIAAALAPVKTTLQRHTDRLNTLESLNRQVAVIVGNGLRALPWGVAGTYVGNFDQWMGSYLHLWRQVFTFLTPQVNALRNGVIPQIQRELATLTTKVTRITTVDLPAIRTRLTTIEKAIGGILADPTTWILGLLGAVAVPALTATGMRTALRSLTCRNTRSLAQRACELDENMIAQLLAGTLVFAIALDPRIIAQAGQEVTAGMMAVFRETALR